MIQSTHRPAAALLGLAGLLIASACALDLDMDAEMIGDDASTIECPPVPKDRADYELLQQIEEMGLCAGAAVDLGDEYLVEGDVAIDKARLEHKQARTSSLVSSTNVRNITVRVDGSIPTGGVDDWRAATQDAIEEWNDITRTPIRFVLTTAATADIRVIADGGVLSNNTIADAQFPSGGNPGGRIRVNLDFLSNLSVPHDQKLYNMVHELGHCIGFRHTNWAARGESSAIQIAGTPTTDSASVMNGGTAGNSWAGFSSGDLAGARVLYPFLPYLHEEYAGCHFGTAKYLLSWGPGTIDVGISEYELQRKSGSTWVNHYVGTGTGSQYNAHTGRNYFRLRALTDEGWSNRRSMSFDPPDCFDDPPHPNVAPDAAD